MSVFCSKSRPAVYNYIFEFVSFEAGFMLLPNEPCQYPSCDFCEKVNSLDTSIKNIKNTKN